MCNFKYLAVILDWNSRELTVTHPHYHCIFTSIMY
jgi:hypothetical protein